ncbi:hypothetical protein Taro_012607 [Colocasia esculenta]|uniref:Thaumatin-like protein n=1 Tax=Colocasia esculenta TaxID=4460 RepID=A0A843UJM1_COLES|nr:hypothetical protein [Colocasia esculenta]
MKIATMRALRIASTIPCFFLLMTIYFSSAGDAQGVEPVIFEIQNKCPFPIWPATTPNSGHSAIASGSFLLSPGSSQQIEAPPSWNGRLWARTGCNFDSSAGKPSCQTGDCEGLLECSTPGMPPATIVSLQADKGEPSYYDVSLLDGYNLPVSVAARPPQPGCFIAGCLKSPNTECPTDLQVLAGEGSGGGAGQSAVVACKSACLAYDQDEYCCRNQYGTPETCQPSSFSTAFKEACPSYLSYAFDDIANSLHSCYTKEFVVTFCPSEWSSE